MGTSGLAWAQNYHCQDYMRLAQRAYQSKKVDMALEYYQAAADDNEQYWQAFQGLGTCYYLKGKKKDALTAFEKAYQLNPGNNALLQFIQALRRVLGMLPLAIPTPTPVVNSMPVPVENALPPGQTIH